MGLEQVTKQKASSRSTWNGEKLVPLTPQQHDIWLTNALDPGSSQFTCTGRVNIEGPVDAASVADAAYKSMARHDAWRIRFIEHDNVTYQFISATPDAVEIIDLRGTAESAVVLSELLKAESCIHFTLDNGLPTAHIVVLILSDDQIVLHIAVSHIIADARTGQMFMEEVVGRLTNADSNTITEPAAAPSFLDYAEQLQKSARSREANDFAEKLHGYDFIPLSPVANVKVTARSVWRGFFATTGLRELRRSKITPTAYTAAVLCLLLARTQQKPDIVIGLPVANRSTQNRNTHGCFSSVLPLRVSVDEDETFVSLALRVTDGIRNLKNYEHVSIGEIAHALRDAGESTKLFDVTLSFMRYPASKSITGLKTETRMSTPVHERDALSVLIRSFEGEANAELTLEGNNRYFDHGFSLENFATVLQNVLVACMANPEQLVGSVDLLAFEQSAAIAKFEKNPVEPTAYSENLVGVFLSAANEHYNRPAITDWQLNVRTYGEVLDRARQIAGGLKQLSVGRGDRVVVILNRSLDLIPTLVGIMMSGAAYVPVDADYPQERIDYVVQDSQPKLVVVDDHLARQNMSNGYIVRTPVSLSYGMPVDDGVKLSANDAAYVIYTSGSTGKPKGVAVSHGAIANRIRWMQHAYPIGQRDVILQKTPISFDVSVWELFWWFYGGATVVLAEPSSQGDPQRLIDLIRRASVSIIHFVPSMLGPFLETVRISQRGVVASCPTLRTVFASGEALPSARVRDFYNVFGRPDPHRPILVNLYGPTEAAVDVSWHDCKFPIDERMVPIGRPIHGVSLFVLDTRLRRVPIGHVGELYIGGVAVADYYHDRRGLTASRFVASGEGGSRLYRTGDLARWLPGGSLEYLGRNDGQVKIRGNRVELSEVESALLGAPGCIAAGVVVSDEQAFRGHLIGFCQLSAGTSVADIEKYASSILPKFMLPTVTVQLDKLPIMPNGKLDRKSLKSLRPVMTSSTDYRAPSTDIEREIAGIFSEILDLSVVDTRENFFALGGDSISAIRLRVRAAAKGFHFALGDFVANPTVEGVCEVLVTDTPADAVPEPYSLVPAIDIPHLVGYSEALPLSQMQLGMIFHSQQYEDSWMYHDVFRYRFSGIWNSRELQRNLDAVYSRHAVLTSVFDLNSYSVPLQIFDSSRGATHELYDLSGLPSEEVEKQSDFQFESLKETRYDSSHEPWYRLKVIVSDYRLDIILAFHHALLDGASAAMIISNIVTQGTRATPPGYTTPANDTRILASSLAAENDAVESKDHVEWWKAELQDARPAELPNLVIAGSRPGASRASTGWTAIDGDILSKLEAVALTCGVSVKSILFAAYGQTLRLMCGQEDDLITGLVTHNRPAVLGGDEACGMFLNTIPIRVLSENANWRASFVDAYKREQRSYAHAGFPLSMIAHSANYGSVPFVTAFNYINFDSLRAAIKSGEIELDTVDVVERTNLELMFNVMRDPRDSSLKVRLEHNPSSVLASQCEQFVDFFSKILARSLVSPDEAVDFTFMVEQRSTTFDVDNNSTVISMFDDRVELHPGNVAIEHNGSQVSYGSLAVQSAIIRQEILNRVVSPRRIALMLPRGAAYVCSLIGVMASGAACVPIDLSYPQSKISALLEQIEPDLIIYARSVADPSNSWTGLDIESLDMQSIQPGAGRLEPVDKNAIAYILFTSGSTGVPKPVMMPHAGLSNLVRWQCSIDSGRHSLNTLQYASIGFDVSFQEIFSTLCNGGTLHLIDDNKRKDMYELIEILQMSKIDRLFLPYIALEALAQACQEEGRWPSYLTVLISSGEQLRVTDSINELLGKSNVEILENQYGPTETHVVTVHTMRPQEAPLPLVPSIGHEISGADVQIRDGKGHLVPEGAVGEICVSGVCLAGGYFRQSSATLASFKSDERGDVYYRTGDLGVFHEHTGFVCLGRADRQVKIRGFRVEPGEVEAAILACGHVREVAVVDLVSSAGETILVAYAVCNNDASIVQTSLELRQVLPSHMVPSRFVQVPSIPLTSSGKRDDDSLRRIPFASDPGRRPDDSEMTPLEASVRDIVADLIDDPDLCVDDNIFDRGASSLTTIKLSSLLSKGYSRKVTIAQVISTPTVRALAEWLRQEETEAQPSPVVALTGSDGLHSRHNLFVVHPMGGGVGCYVSLARHLEQQVNVYGLQAPGLDGGQSPYDSIDALASYYIFHIRELQKSGPYLISGWSFGGYVAFEIAHQMRREGLEVQLTVIDSTALNPGGYVGSIDDSMLDWFFLELMWAHTSVQGNAHADEVPNTASLESRLRFVADKAVEAGILSEDGSLSVIRRMFDLYRAHLKAASNYVPPVLQGQFALLRATDPMPASLLPMHTLIGSAHEAHDNGWSRWTASRPDVHIVPGDHLTLMSEPNVQALSSTILAQVSRVSRPGSKRGREVVEGELI